jgi:hypothetical protein
MGLLAGREKLEEIAGHAREVDPPHVNPPWAQLGIPGTWSPRLDRDASIRVFGHVNGHQRATIDR